MSIQLYVKAQSKADLNRRLLEYERIIGLEYKLGGETQYVLDETLPSGTIIKVFKDVIAGSPCAKAYGQWDAENCQVK